MRKWKLYLTIFITSIFVKAQLSAAVVATIAAAVTAAVGAAAGLGVAIGAMVTGTSPSNTANTINVNNHLRHLANNSSMNSAAVVSQGDAFASRLLVLSQEDLLVAVGHLSPVIYSSHIFSNLQNDTKMAKGFDRAPRGYINYLNPSLNNDPSCPEKKSCGYSPERGLSILPILLYEDRKGSQGSIIVAGQPGYFLYTYGTGISWQQILTNQFSLGGAIGYTHSNKSWRSEFGNSEWSTLYLAPLISWFSHHTFLNFQVMGAFSFFKTARKYVAPGIEEYAKSRYNIYDVLVHANGGYIFQFKRKFALQLEGTLNFLTIFMDSITESGAGIIDLEVKSRQGYILQPEITGRLIKQFYSKKFYYAPNIYVGWLDNILLKNDMVKAKFVNVNSTQPEHFSTRGYFAAVNQLILGGEFFAQRCEKFQLTGNFEFDLLSHFKVYTTRLKLDWFF